MKSIKTLLATSTLFTAMFHAPYATILTILALVVLSDILAAITPTIPALPATRADDAAAWDAIFTEPDPIDEPPIEGPIILSYRDIQHEIKAKYTASQRKKLGIKLNASRTVLESWL